MVRLLVTDIPGHNEGRGGAAAGGVSRAAPRLGAGGGAQDSAANDPSAAIGFHNHGPTRARRRPDCEADGSFTALLLRTGGLSAGKFDVYYYPPEGKPKCRSKPEMVKVLGDSVDLTGFDFSAGVFTSSIIKPRGGGKPRPGSGARERASNKPSRRFHSQGEGLHIQDTIKTLTVA